MADRKEELVSGTGAEGTTAITPQGNRSESLRVREMHPGDMGALLFDAGYRLDLNPYIRDVFNGEPVVYERGLTDTDEDITLKHICLPIGAYLADGTSRDMEAPARVMGYGALADEQKEGMFERLVELSAQEESESRNMSPADRQRYEDEAVHKARKTLLGDLTPEGCALFDPEFVKEHGAEKCVSFLGLLGVEAERIPDVIPSALLDGIITRAQASIATLNDPRRAYHEGEKEYEFNTSDPSMRHLLERHPVLLERAVCRDLFKATKVNVRMRDDSPATEAINSYRDNGAFYRWSPGVQALIEKYHIPECSDEEMRHGHGDARKKAFVDAMQKETDEVVSSVIRQNPESAQVIKAYIEKGLFTDASSSTRIRQLVETSGETGTIAEVRTMLIDILRSTLTVTEKEVCSGGSPPLDFPAYVIAQRGLHTLENPKDMSSEASASSPKPLYDSKEVQPDGSHLIRTESGEPLVSVPSQFILTNPDYFGHQTIDFNTPKERAILKSEIELAQNEKARLDEKIVNLTRALDEAQKKAQKLS